MPGPGLAHDLTLQHKKRDCASQARNQDFMWGVGGGGGANEAKVDQTAEMYFLLSDPFI